MSSQRYRSSAAANKVIAFSVSWQREGLLARGLGLEHLRELLLRLARPILRHGAHLAYGGSWDESREGNFTYDLLRLIRAEQEDNSLGGPDTNLPVGQLYNHLAWPLYLEVTPRIEAQWVNCCRIVRVSQKLAGIPPADVLPDGAAPALDGPVTRNRAICLSAMRRLMMKGMTVRVPGVKTPESVPPVVARVMMAGKVDSYQGFLPGVFEEALVTLEKRRPLYILGGFGGAAELLAAAMLGKGRARPQVFKAAWHAERIPAVAALGRMARKRKLPRGIRTTEQALTELFEFVLAARRQLSATLGTGLDDKETRELMTTSDVATAVRLVRIGLERRNKLPPLAR